MLRVRQAGQCERPLNTRKVWLAALQFGGDDSFTGMRRGILVRLLTPTFRGGEGLIPLAACLAIHPCRSDQPNPGGVLLRNGFQTGVA